RAPGSSLSAESTLHLCRTCTATNIRIRSHDELPLREACRMSRGNCRASGVFLLARTNERAARRWRDVGTPLELRARGPAPDAANSTARVE
ncbi:unnamed protein product, partial [Ectocarpus sp. 8 AP-2014]